MFMHMHLLKWNLSAAVFHNQCRDTALLLEVHMKKMEVKENIQKYFIATSNRIFVHNS